VGEAAIAGANYSMVRSLLSRGKGESERVLLLREWGLGVSIRAGRALLSEDFRCEIASQEEARVMEEASVLSTAHHSQSLTYILVRRDFNSIGGPANRSS